jgi:IrrE N-terminal-like domain
MGDSLVEWAAGNLASGAVSAVGASLFTYGLSEMGIEMPGDPSSQLAQIQQTLNHIVDMLNGIERDLGQIDQEIEIQGAETQAMTAVAALSDRVRAINNITKDYMDGVANMHSGTTVEQVDPDILNRIVADNLRDTQGAIHDTTAPASLPSVYEDYARLLSLQHRFLSWQDTDFLQSRLNHYQSAQYQHALLLILFHHAQNKQVTDQNNGRLVDDATTRERINEVITTFRSNMNDENHLQVIPITGDVVRKLDKEFIEGRVEYILNQVGVTEPPVNLLKIALFQKVRRIELGPMIIEGCTEPVQAGFHIFIRNEFSTTINLHNGADAATLKPRQRFTLAHEIAHTFFYDFQHDPPKVSKGAPKSDVIERLCNLAAGHILLPQRHLELRLSGYGSITAQAILKIGKEFGVSAEVVIRRLNELDKFKAPVCALLLVGEDQSKDTYIRSVYFHPSLLPYLRKPKPFSVLREWSNVFHKVEEFRTEAMWDHTVERGYGYLLFRKRPHPTRKDTFFIEVEYKLNS